MECISATNPRRPPGPRQRSAQERPDYRRVLGRVGEDIAASHLERLGFAILARNYRTRHGEIDLIAFDGKTLAFVEVKTRRGAAPRAAVAPLESLRPRQQARLRGLATAWLQDRTPGIHAQTLRFDAIGIVVDSHDRLIGLDHVEGAW